MSMPGLMISDWRLNRLRKRPSGDNDDHASDDFQVRIREDDAPRETVFLLDVDNTLLDNDRFAAELTTRLTRSFGAVECQRYWSLFATLRDELGYADYLGALQAFRNGLDDDPELLQLSAFLLEYPFAQRLFPHALEVIAHLRRLGLPVVLTDGDVVFQPRKVQRSGIWDAVEGRVLIHLHKERSLASVQQRFPALHYVMVDDKPQLLAAMKRILGPKLRTVFVRQGHYAADAAGLAIEPTPDVCIDHIGQLLAFNASSFLVDAAVPIAVSGKPIIPPEQT